MRITIFSEEVAHNVERFLVLGRSLRDLRARRAHHTLARRIA